MSMILQELPLQNSLTEKEICEKFFQEFATYHSDHTVKTNGILLMAGTAIQYLSAEKELVKAKFSSNPIWVERKLDTWYPFLRLAIETMYPVFAQPRWGLTKTKL